MKGTLPARAAGGDEHQLRAHHPTSTQLHIKWDTTDEWVKIEVAK
jgi:hypothetical protein